ncbi:alcohol dehydrogenase transcription factor myb/SANT-like domain-containing protein [Ditylenchus destructor]|uniref:Alcohol dehydrogenase transcription factor myb/SANT-like domain-containing protein n=1 Tax=Ditylenchus destructor TaxID=166010 RepID=A0AAD4N979_9BILA|nr:alcohol dehydrogenase transcription factor myb/SANT-like domain-containing protein [Ditylenchus destructor]
MLMSNQKRTKRFSAVLWHSLALLLSSYTESENSMTPGSAIVDSEVSPGEHSYKMNANESHFSSSRKSTCALYSDELRLAIIEEVFKRPLLWDNVNREPASMAQRKESFEDIADALKSLDSSLTGGAVEKQWKNLKDTYNKVKKKLVLNENGPNSTPKWRFYHSMLFIDQGNVHATIHSDREAANFTPDSNVDGKKRQDCTDGTNNNEMFIPNKMVRIEHYQEDQHRNSVDEGWSSDEEYGGFDWRHDNL